MMPLDAIALLDGDSIVLASLNTNIGNQSFLIRDKISYHPKKKTMVTMNSFSGSDDDYEVYSLPIEVELANDADADDNHWKDSSNSAEAEAAGSKKKSWKYIIPLAIALAVSGAVLGALLSGKRSISMTSLEQLQPAIADEDTKTKSVVKASKSSKSGRGEETFGGGLEAGSMSMSHFSDDYDNSFTSMSFPSIESQEFCMSFLYIESNSVDLNDHSIVSQVKASKSSKSGRDEETFGGGLKAGSMSMSHFSDDHETFISMSFPSIESHEFCMSFLYIESNSVDLNDHSIVSQVKASKSSKSGRDEETFGGGLEAGSMSMSHFSDDHDNSFISMSFQSIESQEFCMSFLSIESNSVDITGDSIVSQHENETKQS